MNEATERGLTIAEATIKRAHEVIHQMGGIKPSAINSLPALIERILNEINHTVEQEFYPGAIKPEDMAAVLEFIENWQPSEELLNMMKCKQQGEE